MKLRFTLLLIFTAVLAAAQSTIFVVRHCDRYGTEPDPDITPLGHRQAEAIGSLLADANIRHIYTTDLVRTQQTAAPTARRAGVKPVIVNQKDLDGLIRQVKATLRPNESTLVVGHRGSVPRIVKALTGVDIPKLTSGEFTRMVVITLPATGPAAVVTLRYWNEGQSIDQPKASVQ